MDAMQQKIEEEKRILEEQKEMAEEERNQVKADLEKREEEYKKARSVHMYTLHWNCESKDFIMIKNS